jgi:phosphate/sulfate permease
VSTRALSPRLAVAVASAASLAGAFVPTAVGKTVGKGVIDTKLATEKTVLAALFGAAGGSWGRSAAHLPDRAGGGIRCAGLRRSDDYLTTRLGYRLSTTHVVSGSVMGATKRLSAVRWGVAGNIVVARVLTIPAAAAAAAAFYRPIQGIF